MEMPSKMHARNVFVRAFEKDFDLETYFSLSLCVLIYKIYIILKFPVSFNF